jgi:hypothetical protein
MICTPPSGNPGPDCGIYVGPAANLTNWAFYPFPANDVGIVDEHEVFPQQYICVGNATELWSFHFDSRTYTPGCRRAPDWQGIFGRPCDTFLYVGTPTMSPLYAQHGKPAACAVLGTVIVGVMEGKPQPGIALCDTLTAADAERAPRTCGISFDPALSPSPWSFFPLPVASGPIDNATFDTTAGTACVTAGGQSFTFTVPSRAVTAGCSP